MQHLFAFFPQILFLAPLGVFVLRIAVAGFFIYTALHIFKHRHAVTHIHAHIPIVDKVHPWMMTLGSTLIMLVGILMFIGYATQLVALIAAAISIKHAYVWQRYLPTLAPLPSSSYILLAIISLSIVVLGSGALAIDLPL